MAGTVEGGKQAAKTNREKYGPDFYSNIGSVGGKKGHTGGFAADRDKAAYYGKIGGTLPRRGNKTERPGQEDRPAAAESEGGMSYNETTPLPFLLGLTEAIDKEAQEL